MTSNKFPRIIHLPWSPGEVSGDKKLTVADSLMGRPLIISEKLDGSNVCLTRQTVFARSHSGPPKHLSFDLLKQVHAEFARDIPPAFSVFGEWIYAVHSIEYSALPAYLHLFAVRDDTLNRWWSWMDTVRLAKKLRMPVVPLLWAGTSNSKTVLRRVVECHGRQPSCYGPVREGVVVRWAGDFTNEDFHLAMAKWVRPGHVQSDEHWSAQSVRRQPLARPRA